MPPELIISPLIEAVITCQIEVVRMLLSCREVHVDVNYCNSRGESALITCAILCGQNQKPPPELVIIAAMLLRAGADRFIADANGNTAFHHVTQSIKTPVPVTAVVGSMSKIPAPTSHVKSNSISYTGSSETHSAMEKALLEAEAQVEAELFKNTLSDVSVVGSDVKAEMKHLLMYDPKKNTLSVHEIVKNGGK